MRWLRNLYLVIAIGILLAVFPIGRWLDRPGNRTTEGDRICLTVGTLPICWTAMFLGRRETGKIMDGPRKVSTPPIPEIKAPERLSRSAALRAWDGTGAGLEAFLEGCAAGVYGPWETRHPKRILTEHDGAQGKRIYQQPPAPVKGEVWEWLPDAKPARTFCDMRDYPSIPSYIRIVNNYKVCHYCFRQYPNYAWSDHCSHELDKMRRHDRYFTLPDSLRGECGNTFFILGQPLVLKEIEVKFEFHIDTGRRIPVYMARFEKTPMIYVFREPKELLSLAVKG